MPFTGGRHLLADRLIITFAAAKKASRGLILTEFSFVARLQHLVLFRVHLILKTPAEQTLESGKLDVIQRLYRINEDCKD